jgi:hypothetical protein
MVEGEGVRWLPHAIILCTVRGSGKERKYRGKGSTMSLSPYVHSLNLVHFDILTMSL